MHLSRQLVSRPTATVNDSAALAARCQHRRHLYHHHHHLRLLPPLPLPRFPCLCTSHSRFTLPFRSSTLLTYAGTRARSPMLHVLNPLTPPSYLAQPLPTRTSTASIIFFLFNFSSLLLLSFLRIPIFPFQSIPLPDPCHFSSFHLPSNTIKVIIPVFPSPSGEIFTVFSFSYACLRPFLCFVLLLPSSSLFSFFLHRS